MIWVNAIDDLGRHISYPSYKFKSLNFDSENISVITPWDHLKRELLLKFMMLYSDPMFICCIWYVWEQWISIFIRSLDGSFAITKCLYSVSTCNIEPISIHILLTLWLWHIQLMKKPCPTIIVNIIGKNYSPSWVVNFFLLSIVLK